MSDTDEPGAYGQQLLDEARGAYIGPVGRDEALAAIRAHHTGPVIVEYPERGFVGGERRRTSGWQSEVGCAQDGDTTGVFAFTERQQIPLGAGLAYADAFVLDLAPEGWTAEQYIGGLDLRFGADTLVRLVFWRSAWSPTPSGDDVPGMTFRASIGEAEDDPEGE